MTDTAVEGPIGLVYQWEPSDLGGPLRAVPALVRLSNLEGRPGDWRGLRGKYVRVRNASTVYIPAPGGDPCPTAVGDALPDQSGSLVFEPGRGGGRIDKMVLADSEFRARYVQASRFGEVNAYHHTDRAAAYLDALLRELGASSLPPAVAIVNAHHAAVDIRGQRDGRRTPDHRWVPFQGGHYRLPGAASRIVEHAPLSHDGEIHLGPGQKLARRGALSRLVGGGYRANASHNPAIIYHEYGHHLCRHTADFRANRLRAREMQSNRKTALDEGTADYFTAVMLGTPHIWFFHHLDDAIDPHRRSLGSPRRMKDYVSGPAGDPHSNGTIWAATLWELRTRVDARTIAPRGANAIDRLVVQALLLIGEDGGGAGETVRSLAARRRSFRRAGAALLGADVLLYGGLLRDDIARTLAARGIHPEGSREPVGVAAP